MRKILKSRRSERLDLDGLQHILDEAVHALRLKKAAVALGRQRRRRRHVRRRRDAGGDAGEAYLQALDRRAEEALVDLPAGDRAEANYRLTSAAIEVRAQVFYPIYERVPARQRRRVLGRGDLEGRGPPPGGDGGGAGAGAARLAPRGWRRCSPPRRRSTPVSWPRSRRRCRHRVPMAQFRSLSADDVRGILRRVRRRGLSRPPADRGRHHQHQRARRDRRTGRCSCASTRASRRTTCGARRPSSRTPPRAACRRRCRAPTPAGAPFARWRDELVSLFPWVPGRTLARAELTPAHAAAVGAALARLHLRERRLRRPPPGPLRARRDRRAPGAHRGARRAPSSAPAVAVLAPELAQPARGARRRRCRSGIIHGDLFVDNVLYDDARRADGADRLRAGVVGAPRLRPGGDDAGVRLSAATTSAPRSCAR